VSGTFGGVRHYLQAIDHEINASGGFMKFRPVALACECGRVPSRLNRLGFTPGHQLVIHWRCLGCKKDVYVVKDLAECWRDCPKPEDASENPADELVREPDISFLHSLGIRFPDEAES
jgi:hypothetical protein